jgi:hypothetical protein
MFVVSFGDNSNYDDILECGGWIYHNHIIKQLKCLPQTPIFVVFHKLEIFVVCGKICVCGDF